MMARVINWLAFRLAKLVIWWCWRKPDKRIFNITGSTPDDVYMIRYKILEWDRIPWRVYIHQFIRPDRDTYHDHPWGFWTYIIRGGYTEKILVDPYWPAYEERRLDAGWHGFRDNTHKHYIAGLHNNPLTFVATTRKKSSWSFWPQGLNQSHHPVPWRDFLNSEIKKHGH